jgi:hypothetical protein
MTRAAAFGLVLSLATVVAATAVQGTALGKGPSLRAGGAWQSGRKGSQAAADVGHGAGRGVGGSPTRRWAIDAEWDDDGSVHGRLTLLGSPIVQAGDVHAHVVGQTVIGRVVDDWGNEVVQFHGRITEKGMTGWYTDQTGDTGSWSWDGPPPQQ